MSVLIKNMEMPKGCIYANDNDQTEYCPLLNHDDVPFCQYIENEPEIAIGIDERPVYCPLSDVPEPCQDTIYRQDAIDAFGLSEKTRKYDGDHSGYDTRMLYEIQDVLEGLPPAQPEQRWIPSDKGEPDEGMECWVAVKTTDALYRGNFTKRYGERRDKGFITSGGFMWWNTALAWMPVYEPEPYKAESEE